MRYLLTLCLLFASALLPRLDTVLTRFKTPVGYVQKPVEANSFGEWLQQIPLKPAGTRTHTYRGDIAHTDVYTAAVVDISIGTQDLQQCADAVMRLRGEYLYHQKKYKDISFNFVNGFRCDYVHYADGYRYRNNKWMLLGKKDHGYDTFMRYMTLVFGYASTLSLEKELRPVTNADDVRTGDVFIRGGVPGHCFIVMDVVENSAHKQQFLLAQSFMPAQNFQVLQDGSPWFSLDKQSDIAYGELIDLKYLRHYQ